MTVINTTMRTNKPSTRYSNPILIATVVIIILCSHANAYGDTAVIPIPSIRVDYNLCKKWSVTVTYTATPVPSSVLDQLTPINAIGLYGHFHADGRPGGEWKTLTPVSGSPSQKLDSINAGVFGDPRPQIGRTTTATVWHEGSCAADQGLRECVGIFVSPSYGIHRSNEPTTFPMGLCSGIPPTGTSCEFDSPNGSVSLGTGGVGSRGGTTAVHVSCSRPVVYRVSELPGTADPASLQIVTLTVQGAPLPYVSPGTQATENLTIGVEAKVSSEGFLSTQRVLRIDIP